MLQLSKVTQDFKWGENIVRKILHVTMSDTFSGAENVACQIISMFKNDSDTEMLYCGIEGPKIRNALKERKIQFVPMCARTPKEVARVIRETKPTIIHAHDMKASFYVALTCGKIPFVSHVHNNNVDSRGLSAKSILYYFAAQKAEHIFWVSKSAYEGYAFHEKFKGKSSILYNVIDADEVYRKAAQDEKEYAYDIVYVGRLTTPKNPQRLVEVLAGVGQKCQGMKAAIVGAGDLETETKEKRQELHAEGCIDMLGYSSNPYKIMKNAKILIMTSRWEGLPMCALEAMALGVPIVSTPTDGLREIVENGKTGYLSDEDSVLIDRCVDILENNELYQKLHQATLEKAAKILDVKSYKAALDQVYRQTM